MKIESAMLRQSHTFVHNEAGQGETVEPIRDLLSLPEYASRWESVYEQIRPSVVQIKILSIKETVNPDSPQAQKKEMWTQTGVGSGFFVSEDGCIMTNRHVAFDEKGEKRRLVVRLADGTELASRVITPDPSKDIALIQVLGAGGRTFKPLPFASKNSVKPGQEVMIMGSPYNEEGSVAIDHVARISESPQDSEYAGQATVIAIAGSSMHPGNSGGPMVNFAGEVIGVSSFIVGSPRSGSIGKAISGDDVETLVTHREFFAGFYPHFEGIMRQRGAEKSTHMEDAFIGLISAFQMYFTKCYNMLPLEEQARIQDELLADRGVMACFRQITVGCRKPKKYAQIFYEAFGKQLYPDLKYDPEAEDSGEGTKQ